MGGLWHSSHKFFQITIESAARSHLASHCRFAAPHRHATAQAKQGLDHGTRQDAVATEGAVGEPVSEMMISIDWRWWFDKSLHDCTSVCVYIHIYIYIYIYTYIAYTYVCIYNIECIYYSSRVGWKELAEFGVDVVMREELPQGWNRNNFPIRKWDIFGSQTVNSMATHWGVRLVTLSEFNMSMENPNFQCKRLVNRLHKVAQFAWDYTMTDDRWM